MADVSTSPTNADTPATTDNGGGDSGLDAPVKTLDQTQSTSTQFGSYDSEFFAPTSAGVGANDNNPDPTGVNLDDGSYDRAENARFARQSGNPTSVAGALNTNSRPQIVPQPNVLDKFSSYTYRISVYLMTPAQYNQLARSHKKNINGYNLLFQSGGAPTNTGGFQGALNTNTTTADALRAAEATEDEIRSALGRNTGTGTVDAGRNPAFPLDFYIDNCQITNLMQGKGTGSSHSVAAMKFTVIEPVGITLIDRIYEAVQDSAPAGSKGKVNYQNAQYLMAIRWYGYDQNGNIVGGTPNNSDPRAVVEKFIPFVINKINWRVTTKATEYEFDCTPVGQIIASGTRRGVVPYDIQLSQGTVGKILAGDLAFVDKPTSATQPGVTTANQESQQTPAAPAKANAAATPKQTVKQGLMAAMNEFTKSLTTGATPVYEIADQYEIVFAKGAEAIRDATIVLPEAKKEARLTPMNQPATTNSQSLNPATQGKDTSISTKSIFAGQPIVQIIDQVIRNSSYVTGQALTLYEDQEEKSNDDNKQKKKPVDWYRINFEAVPIGDKPDARRNDYAYKIRYIISAYRIDNYDSKYFPLGSFRGVHKSYPWIFTGKNTAVIDYSETLNSAYNMLVSGSDPTNSAAETERRKVAATMRELVTYTYGARSSETSQGTRSKNNEVSANLADSLYGGADLANTKLTIIGDPAWLQQGSIAGGVQAELYDSNSFLPDGTINFDAEQIMFEVTWSRPSDYNIQTGLADPNSINRPPISRVYTASKVTSDFKQGNFTQTIEGLLFTLPKPDGSNKAPTARMPAKGDVTRETDARAAFAAVDPRRIDKAAAGIGATGSTAISAPAISLPVNIQQVNTNGTPVTTADSVRAAPPPDSPTSGTGEDLGVIIDETGQTSRFRRNLETGELYDPGSAGVVNNTQDQSWEP